MAGIDAGRHGLHALAFARLAEAGDVGAERFLAIAMPEDPGQLVHIGGEAAGPRALGRRHTSRMAAYPMLPQLFLTQ